jgi:hypothetical protein
MNLRRSAPDSALVQHDDLPMKFMAFVFTLAVLTIAGAAYSDYELTRAEPIQQSSQ